MTPQEKIDKALVHLKATRKGVRRVIFIHSQNRYMQPVILLLDRIDNYLADVQTILEEE